MSENLNANYIFQRQQEILDDFFSCNTFCVDIGQQLKPIPNRSFDKIEYFLRVLPGIEYVKTLYIFYLFSNDLTTGKVDDDKRLNEFLFRLNKNDKTNKEVLKNAVGTAILWGVCGVRKFKGDIYEVPPGKYGKLMHREDGIETVVAYFTKENGENIEKGEVNLDEIVKIEEGETIIEVLQERFNTNGYILLDKSEFIEIKNPTTQGESPLLYDALRLELLVTAYEQMNHDLKFNGPGRHLVRPEKGYFGGGDNDISTAKVLDNSEISKDKRDRAAKKEAQNLMVALKESKPDSIIYLPRELANDITPLPKNTKATEFLEWIEQEGVILAQVLGLSPSLLELGRLSGNVSMEKIIDNSMLNNIVPAREGYATQFSPLLSAILNVDYIHFDKYEMEQTEDENNMLAKRADMLVKIASVDNPLSDEVITAMLTQINTYLHYDNGELRELSLGKKEYTDGNARDTGKGQENHTLF